MDAKGNIIEIGANCGFSNTGNTLLWPDDAGLNAAFTKYSLPLKNSDGDVDFETFNNLDLTAVPEADVRMTKTDRCIKDFAVQPYENVAYVGAVVTYLGDKVTYLKEHLIP